MSLAVSTIVSDARWLFDDDSVPTLAQAVRHINRCRKEILQKTLCVEDEYTLSSAANTFKHTIETIDLSSSTALNVWRIKEITWWDNETPVKLTPFTLERFNSYSQETTQSDLTGYYVDNRSSTRKVWFFPRLTSAADTVTLAGTHTNAVTTIHVSSGISSLPSVGKIRVTDAANGNETIEYQGKNGGYTTGTVTVTNSSTTVTGSGTEWDGELAVGDKFSIDDSTWYTILTVDSDTQITLSGAYAGSTSAGEDYYAGYKLLICERGAEGSTAFQHADGDTATERDIHVTYFRMPRTLATTDNVEQVFEMNSDVLVYYIAWQAATHDTDGAGSGTSLRQAAMFKSQYEQALADFQLTFQTDYDTFGVIGQPSRSNKLRR